MRVEMLFRKVLRADSGASSSSSERSAEKDAGDSWIEAHKKTLIDRENKYYHLAIIKPEEFLLAQLSIFDLRDYGDYEEWMEAQESRQFGLAIAGVEARRIPIELSAFLDWCQHTLQRPNSSTLDKYAAAIARDD
jgi:hypothetical protein